MANDFFQQQLDIAKAQIVELTNAQTAILTGAIESYRLDTGQSVTQVTKLNVDVLNRMIDSLLNRVSVLEARCTGNNVLIMRPAY